MVGIFQNASDWGKSLFKVGGDGLGLSHHLVRVFTCNLGRLALRGYCDTTCKQQQAYELVADDNILHAMKLSNCD